LLWMMAFCVSCKSTEPTSASTKEYQLSCAQPPNNIDPPKMAVLRVNVEEDSIVASRKRTDEYLFFRSIENEVTPINIYKELNDHIRYPQALIESEIQGRWIYEVQFDQQKITSWTLHKKVDGGALMEKEIERTFENLKQYARYFYPNKCTIGFVFIVNLER